MNSKLFVLCLVIFCAESLNAQRFKRAETMIFNRVLRPLRNLVNEITSRSIRNVDSSVYPPETFLSSMEIIRFHGYPVEEHKVETKDGYIISIFRIIHTQKKGGEVEENELEKNEQKSTGVKREPVLVQHGISCSSDDFLQLNPKDILPYLLSDSGHNVWLGNIRAGPFGKQHVNISSNDPKLNDFTVDDLARDIPEIIKYILKVENAPQLSYVCHSMGCALISMAVSDDPELNQLIKKGSFMAPGIYATHQKSPVYRTLISLPTSALVAYSRHYAGGALMPNNLKLRLRKYGPGICARENTRHFCDNALFLMAGLNPGQIRNKTLVKVFSHFPADTPIKLMVQYSQLIKSDNFQKYDFGREKNLQLYGTTSPPLYELSRVTFPVQGIYGLGDNIILPKDVSRTWRELGNVVGAIQVEDDKWTHLDFLYGKDARKLVYDKIVRFLSS